MTPDEVLTQDRTQKSDKFAWDSMADLERLPDDDPDVVAARKQYDEEHASDPQPITD